MRHGRGELDVGRVASGTTDRATKGHGDLGQWWRWGQRFHRGVVVDVVVGVGLVTYGIVYLLVAVIAVRIAVTGQHPADTPYADMADMDDMAESVAGQVLLWLTALGAGRPHHLAGDGLRVAA